MSTPVVLITGALTGIGRAAAFAFAREGNRVVVSGRHEDVGQALAAELREFGGKAEFIRADVRREDDVRNLVDQTVARFGRLDAAVNSAGTEGKPGPVTEQTADSYAATFDTNVLGTLLSMKHELRVMLDQRSGSIVNVSSPVLDWRQCWSVPGAAAGRPIWWWAGPSGGSATAGMRKPSPEPEPKRQTLTAPSASNRALPGFKCRE